MSPRPHGLLVVIALLSATMGAAGSASRDPFVPQALGTGLAAAEPSGPPSLRGLTVAGTRRFAILEGDAGAGWVVESGSVLPLAGWRVGEVDETSVWLQRLDDPASSAVRVELLASPRDELP